MDERSAAPPAVDVVRIMQEIRESIQRKRQRGIYSEEEVSDQARVRLRAYADEAGIDPKLLDRLLAPSHEWNIGSDYLIRTHRRGLGGKLLLLAKKLVRPFVRLYTDHIFNRQAQLNLYFYYEVRNAIREITRLQIEVTALRTRLEELGRDGREQAGGREKSGG